MIVTPDISPEEFIKRIPFMRKFKDISDENWVHFQKIDYNENVKMVLKKDILDFKQLNTNIEFIYYKEKINDNYFYHFIIKYQLHLTIPDNMSDLERAVLIHVNDSQNKALSFNKQIMSKNERLSDEELSKIINELNEHFFKLENYFEKTLSDIQNPLSENFTKNLIKKHLNILTEAKKKLKKITKIKKVSIEENNP